MSCGDMCESRDRGVLDNLSYRSTNLLCSKLLTSAETPKHVVVKG